MSKLYQWANLTLADTPYKHHSYSCSSLLVFRAHPRYPNTRQLSACQTFFYCYKSTFTPARDGRSHQNAKFLCCLNLQLKTDGCHLDSSLHTQGANLFVFERALCITETFTERCRAKEMMCASTANLQHRWSSEGGCLTAHQATTSVHTAGNTSLSACSYRKCPHQWSTRIHTNTSTME